MILKSMLNLCKKAKRIAVEYYGECKFLSDGKMKTYIGDVAPEWDSSDCAVALELDGDMLEKFTLTDGERDLMPAYTVESMEQVEKLDWLIGKDGITLQPFIMNDGRLFFIDNRRLAVFKDVGTKQYYYFSAALCVAVDGFVVGIIGAVMVNLDEMKQFTHKLHEGVTASADKGFLDAGGQMTIDGA